MTNHERYQQPLVIAAIDPTEIPIGDTPNFDAMNAALQVAALEMFGEEAILAFGRDELNFLVKAKSYVDVTGKLIDANVYIHVLSDAGNYHQQPLVIAAIDPTEIPIGDTPDFDAMNAALQVAARELFGRDVTLADGPDELTALVSGGYVDVTGKLVDADVYGEILWADEYYPSN